MKLGSEDLRTVPLTSSPLAGTKSPVLQSKKRKANTKITRVVSKKTGKPFYFVEENPVSEADSDAAEAEIAAVDGCRMEESELLEQQLIQIVKQMASRASGARVDGRFMEESELLELTRILREGMKRPVAPEFSTLLTSTLLNLLDEIARNAPQTKQGQAYGRYLARTTHALISRSPLKAELRRKGPRMNPRQRQTSENPDLLESNPAYWSEIMMLFGEKDLRLRGATSTKLVNEAMEHFSAVYDVIALTRGGRLSAEQQLVLDHEKLFFYGPLSTPDTIFDDEKLFYEPLSKSEEDTIFNKMFWPWITSLPEEKLKMAERNKDGTLSARFRQSCRKAFRRSYRDGTGPKNSSETLIPLRDHVQSTGRTSPFFLADSFYVTDGMRVIDACLWTFMLQFWEEARITQPRMKHGCECRPTDRSLKACRERASTRSFETRVAEWSASP